MKSKFLFFSLALALFSNNLSANPQILMYSLGGTCVVDAIAGGLSFKSNNDIWQDTQNNTSSKDIVKKSLETSYVLFWTTAGVVAITGAFTLFCKNIVALQVVPSMIGVVLGSVGAVTLGTAYSAPTESQSEQDKIQDTIKPALGMGIAAAFSNWASTAFIVYCLCHSVGN